MSSFTRTRRVFYDWRRAADMASVWAYQTERRYRIHGVRTTGQGWMWVTEPCGRFDRGLLRSPYAHRWVAGEPAQREGQAVRAAT